MVWFLAGGINLSVGIREGKKTPAGFPRRSGKPSRVTIQSRLVQVGDMRAGSITRIDGRCGTSSDPVRSGWMMRILLIHRELERRNRRYTPTGGCRESSSYVRLNWLRSVLSLLSKICGAGWRSGARPTPESSVARRNRAGEVLAKQVVEKQIRYDSSFPGKAGAGSVWNGERALSVS